MKIDEHFHEGNLREGVSLYLIEHDDEDSGGSVFHGYQRKRKPGTHQKQRIVQSLFFNKIDSDTIYFRNKLFTALKFPKN